DRLEALLVPDADGLEIVPIELSYEDYPGTSATHTARMRLALNDIESLVTHDSLELNVATYSTNPRLRRAEITASGTESTFLSAPGAEYRNNSILAFTRRTGCYPLRGDYSGELILTVTFSGPGRLALWTYRPRGSQSKPGSIYLHDPLWSDLGIRVEAWGR